MTEPGPLAAYLSDPAWFGAGQRESIHGWAHTNRVLIWADVLGRADGRPVRLAELRWAAAVHDVARVNNGYDPDHGARAAVWVRTTLPRLRPAVRDIDLELIATLCERHDVEDGADPPLELLMLKDADALDRARFKTQGRMDPDHLRLRALSPLLAGPAQAFCDICRLEPPTTPAAELAIAETRVLPTLDLLWPKVWRGEDAASPRR